MNELYEAMVERFLVANGQTFVCPQYAIPYDAEEDWGGSDPDFVVLDFKHKDLVICEVTSSGSIRKLLEKVQQRERRWYAPVKTALLRDEAITAAWPDPRFIGFIRRSLVDAANEAIPDSDVVFFPLEDTGFAHLYWDARATGLPRRA